MGSYSVGKNDVARYAHLLTKERWTDLGYLTLLKEFFETNFARVASNLTVNVGIHVLPDFTTLDEELFILLEIKNAVLTPHLFINREPTNLIPDLLVLRGYQSSWASGSEEVRVIQDLSPLNDPQMVANIFFLLVHVARRMSEGFKGSLDPKDTVKIMEDSEFFDLTMGIAEILHEQGYSDDFQIQKPGVVQDITGLRIMDMNQNNFTAVLTGIMGSQVDAYFDTFLDRIKASGHFPPAMAINDMLRLTTAMAKVMVASAGFYQKPCYEEVKILIQQGFIAPALGIPHLPPKGKFLRDLLWELGLKNLHAFANTPSRPLGLGVRTPISDIKEMKGTLSSR